MIQCVLQNTLINHSHYCSRSLPSNIYYYIVSSFITCNYFIYIIYFIFRYLSKFGNGRRISTLQTSLLVSSYITLIFIMTNLSIFRFLGLPVAWFKNGHWVPRNCCEPSKEQLVWSEKMLRQPKPVIFPRGKFVNFVANHY